MRRCKDVCTRICFVGNTPFLLDIGDQSKVRLLSLLCLNVGEDGFVAVIGKVEYIAVRSGRDSDRGQDVRPVDGIAVN
jgi:hypothetical protein